MLPFAVSLQDSVTNSISSHTFVFNSYNIYRRNLNIRHIVSCTQIMITYYIQHEINIFLGMFDAKHYLNLLCYNFILTAWLY